MTLAVAAANPTQPVLSQTVPIVVLGTDALLAASPATPVQFAHACLRAGFANVVPASWGDELIAAAVLRRLPNFGSGPVIQCSCPVVAHRLLSVGGDLRPVMVPLVPPPVAVARYIRTLAQPTRTRITYVGACPGAVDEAIDIRMTPDALIAMLAERDIVIEEQPRVFESIIPPDRRRFRSQPGGVPAADALWTELGSRTLVEIDGEDFIAEIAQHLLAGKNVLIDAAARLGCACAGAVNGARHPRSTVAALEPPRATTPVVDEQTPITLDLPVPAAPRTPVDVVAVSSTPPSTRIPTPPSGAEAFGNRISPVRASGPVPIPDVKPPRQSVGATVAPRAVLSAFPVARDTEGKSLPRAYVARRRSSPKGVSVLLPDEVQERVDAPANPAAPTRDAPVTPTTAHGSQVTQPVRAQSVPAVRAESASTKVSVSEPVVFPTVVDVPPQPPAVAEPVRAEPAVRPAEPLSHAPVSVPAAVASNAVDNTPPAQPWSAPLRVSETAAAAAEQPRSTPQVVSQPVWTLSRGQLIGILIAFGMIAISVSTVVAIIVGRSVSGAAAISYPR